MVQKYGSEIFTSNTYTLVLGVETSEIWLIDCGTYYPVLENIPSTYKLKGIFLTHYHYDHIYFIKKWLDHFPELIVYASLSTLEGLKNAKKNLSFYHEDPVEVELDSFVVLKEGVDIVLTDDLSVQVLETPGHCEGSLSFLFKDHLFTGDALIPNIPVVTKLKTGNKLEAKASIVKIKDFVSPSTYICPGHMEMVKAKDVDWELYTA